MKLLSIGVLCLGFLAVNILLRKAMGKVKSQNGVIGMINRYFPMIELAFWAVFSIWTIGILFSDSQFFMYIIFLMIALGFVLFFLFFVKDYMAGILLKSRYGLAINQRFKSGQVIGIIKKLGLLFVEIKAESGSDFRIPYSQIDQKSIELNIQEKSGGENVVQVKLDEKLNEEDTLQKIMELTINSPWSSHKSNPQIVALEVENGLKTYEISCIINGENGGKKLKELIEAEIVKKKKRIPAPIKKS